MPSWQLVFHLHGASALSSTLPIPTYTTTTTSIVPPLIVLSNFHILYSSRAPSLPGAR